MIVATVIRIQIMLFENEKNLLKEINEKCELSVFKAYFISVEHGLIS